MSKRGRAPSPVCPKGCKTKTGKPQHMRRLYTQPYEEKRKFEKIGWICPKCKTIILNEK